MKRLEIKPTKTWLKEHKYKPKECQCVECICILDLFNHNSNGFCVGYYSHNGDLDMLSICWVGWDKDNKELYYHNALMHPAEASMFAAYINFAVCSIWGMIPDYRKQLGKMLRKRTIDIKKRRVK